ncbi:MAG: 4'-phosphopantetheinyl transferase superfamily protein [Chitinophagaceae bacterium]
MPVFFQHQINAGTRLGIWKIEETEEFFRANVPLHRDVTHPHKRLQHLAGRFLLQYLFPAFPYELVQIADTRKPFLPGEQYHFSISHCGDYAAAIVSRTSRAGIDIEIPVQKIMRIRDKFLSEEEKKWEGEHREWPAVKGELYPSQFTTLLWSAKEAVFKWYGDGGVDFSEHIRLEPPRMETNTMDCFFSKTGTPLTLQYRLFDQLVLVWVIS